MSVRYDWYQSDSKVVITVMLKNAKDKNYKVNIEEQRVLMTADDYELDIKLFAPINVERSTYRDFPSKVEITLSKEVGDRWDSLEERLEPKPLMVAPPPVFTKNWDSLAKEVEKTEEKEATGEDGLQRLFQKIYSSATPEVQKAMNKSFSESGGTVLSTNWNEVGKDKVTAKPPEGCEFRKWE